MSLDFSSVKVVRVHKEQYDAIEQKAKSILLTCVEDGRSMSLARTDYRSLFMVICKESSYPDLHVGDIIYNDPVHSNYIDACLSIEAELKKIMASTKGLNESHLELLKDGVEFSDFALTINDLEIIYEWWDCEDNINLTKKSVKFKIIAL